MGDLWRRPATGVAGLAELFGDEAGGELLAGADFARGRRRFWRCCVKSGCCEAVVDDVLVFEVEVDRPTAENGDGRPRRSAMRTTRSSERQPSRAPLGGHAEFDLQVP